ncbi:MAG: thymidine kinase, partial [Acidimicrobiales bacterium]|nr:thymidine kinase [Acidimicrobiales bacterium]
MGSGKSTQALQVHYNLGERGLRCMLLTQLDRTDGVVSSRLGIQAEAVVISPTVDLYRLIAA